MKVEFMKYHGCGNDFLLINFTDEIDYSDLAKKICNRNLGVGADGIIVFQAPSTMLFYNADGSAGSMCGNGLRCLARYLHDIKKVDNDCFIVNTPAGPKPVMILGELIEINLGKPDFSGKVMKIKDEPDNYIGQKICGIEVSAVFTGAAHLVVYVDDIETVETKTGMALSNHSLFTDRINVNFVKMINRETFAVRTFERGVGWTAACGTGAAAVYAISYLKGLCAEAISVRFRYGTVKVHYNNQHQLLLTGPAEKIAKGYFYYK